MPVLLFFAFCFAMLYYTMRPRPTTLKSTSDMEGMREAGRMHVAAKHDWSRNIDRYRAVYQELLGRAPSAAA